MLNRKINLLILALQLPLINCWIEPSYGQTNGVILLTDVSTFTRQIEIPPSGKFSSGQRVSFPKTQWFNPNTIYWEVFNLQYRLNYNIGFLNNQPNQFYIDGEATKDVSTSIYIKSSFLNDAARQESSDTLTLKIEPRFHSQPGDDAPVPEPSSVVTLMSVFGVSLGLLRKRATNSQQSAQSSTV